MNKLFLIVIGTPLLYILGVATLAPLVAWMLYAGFTPELAFSKLVSKTGLALLVLGMIPISRVLKLTTADLGICPRKNKLASQIAMGLFAGCVIMLVVTAVLMKLEVRIVDSGRLTASADFIKIILPALLTGLLVGVIEELVFRGAFLRILTLYVPPVSAIAISAFYFAVLHFFRGPTPTGELTWLSGYEYAASAFANIFRWQNLDTLFALFLAGALLGYIRLISRQSIGYCIGLHAGWVFLIKITKAFTDSGSETQWMFLVGRYDGVTGLFSAFWLAMVMLILIQLNSGSNALKTTPSPTDTKDHQ